MPRHFLIPFLHKKKDYTERIWKAPHITENKRSRIWKDRLGHIIKRRGKFKNGDIDQQHFFCHNCGRIEAKEAIDSGVRN